MKYPIFNEAAYWAQCHVVTPHKSADSHMTPALLCISEGISRLQEIGFNVFTLYSKQSSSSIFPFDDESVERGHTPTHLQP